MIAKRQTLGFWAKSGKTMVACVAAGLLGMLPDAQDSCDKLRQQAPAQVLPDCRAKALCDKEALRLT